MKKLSPLGVGIFNLIAPIPVLLLSTVACWLLFFGVGFGIFGFDNVPIWFQIVSMLPVLLSSLLTLPAAQILGIVLGAMKRRERHGIACIVLSALGFVGNVLLWAACLYAGTHY